MKNHKVFIQGGPNCWALCDKSYFADERAAAALFAQLVISE